MTPTQNNPELDRWVDRTRRMVSYRNEALDFLGRAGEQASVFESDVGVVCHLWAVADEYDEIVCRALSAFDSALFETVGELDITRGVETRPTSETEPSVMFLCTWSIIRPGNSGLSCILYGEQMTGAVGLEVRDSHGVIHPLPFPLEEPSALYEALSDAFFVLAAV